ncbi:serine protease [Streptomyces acidiscabies]|uniref:S1 family peptidase n=1 Tax=Streptomyces acidiscabies TaxID=42234 RepID=UPI0030D2ED2D
MSKLKVVVATVATVAATVIGTSTAYGIVGGAPTTTSKYPFIVVVGDHCTGTLVSPTKVVTNAQCVIYRETDGLQVTAGRSDLDDKNGTVRDVKSAWIPASYADYSTSDGKVPVPHGDVAVLTLAQPMPRAYTPIGIVPSAFVYRAGGGATVLGFGATVTDQKNPDGRLRAAQVPMASNASCKKAYPDAGAFDPSVMTCAGKPTGGVGTCDRDGGAPLLVADGRKTLLAGVNSWSGLGCAKANSPDVYTKLTAFSKELAAQINS